MRFDEIAARASEVRREGQEVVLVLGLGFVGTAVVANLARTRRNEKNVFFVIGLDQDTKPGREKAERLDQGHSPTYADDPSLEEVIARAAATPRQVVGSIDPRVISLADVVVSCINLDLARASGQTDELACRTEGYADAMRMVGKHMRPGTLVCVESTLPLGMCDQILYPALCEGQKNAGVDVKREPPAFAYCYERVMPGPNYLDSVNNYWRAYAGVDEASSEKARAFLSKYVNIAEFPLWKHKSIRAAEMSKLLENSYRATNIAFIEEWARLAEAAGIDLFDVIHSIRVRKGTHDNMMLPGLGVGGYCLTKDALLAAYGAENILKVEAALPFSRRAILTNENMPLRAVELIEAHFGDELSGKKACLFGVTYRPGVGDTRSSPSEIVARALMKRGVDVVAYDSLVTHWEEMPEVPMAADPNAAMRGVEIVVVCLPDGGYKKYLPALLESSMPKGAVVVDPWNMVATTSAQKLKERGVALHVFGRGDVPSARRDGR